MEDTIKLEYIVSAEDFTRAGEASSDLKNILKQMGVSPDTVRKVSIAMYEGEINMVIQPLTTSDLSALVPVWDYLI